MATYGLTLQKLREEVLDLVDDPEGDIYAPNNQYGRVDRLINRAYVFLVNVLDQSGQVFNRSTDPIEIPVTIDAWDYVINVNYPIRRIVEVCIRDDEGMDVPVRMTTYAERLSGLHQSTQYRTIFRPHDTTVYVYRLQTGEWRLSFVNKPEEARSFYVHWLPLVGHLENLADEPRHLPQQWHHLVALRAAWSGMGTEKRENSDAAREYAETLGAFREEISGTVAHGKSRPI